MPKPKSKKADWIPVSGRIPSDLRRRLVEKHSNPGDISKVIHALIDKYLSNRIIGLDLSKYE